MKKLSLLLFLIPIASFGQWEVPKDFSLQEALNGAGGKIKGGDIVTIKSGIYQPVVASHNFSDYVKFIAEDGMIIMGSAEYDDAPNSVRRGLVHVRGRARHYEFINWHLNGNNPYRDSRLDTFVGISNGFDLMQGSNINIYECYVENTGGSGIYLASSCKNVNIKRNIFKYNGSYSKGLKRFSHRNLYIQSWKNSYCNIEDNLLLKGLNYNIQIWHQDGKTVNGVQTASKLVGVRFINNAVVALRETAVHYGGYNKASEGRIIDNSIYYIGRGTGIRVGYTTNASQNMNFDFEVTGNIVQNGHIKIVNPRNYHGTDDIYVTNNLIQGTLSLSTWITDDIYPIICKWTGNTILHTEKDFQWIDFGPGKPKPIQKSNKRVSFKDAGKWGLPTSNTSIKKSNNIIKVIDQNRRKIVVVHNFQQLAKVKLNLEGNVKIVDAENDDVVIYQGKGSEAVVSTNLKAVEKMNGDLPTPAKTGSDYGVFIVYPSVN